MRSRIFISSVQKEFAEERKLLVADVLAAKHSVPKGPSGGLRRGPSQGAVRAQSGLSQKSMTAHTPRESCLALLGAADYGRKDLAAALGVSSRTGYFGRMLAELVEDGLIELTIPEKPNSRLQKYRLTEKGRLVVSG